MAQSTSALSSGVNFRASTTQTPALQRPVPASKARKYARVEREYREALLAFDEVNRGILLELPAFHACVHLLAYF